MEIATIILIMFIDEGAGAALHSIEFDNLAACEAAIEAMPHDTLGGDDVDNGLDWAVCVQKS